MSEVTNQNLFDLLVDSKDSNFQEQDGLLLSIQKWTSRDEDKNIVPDKPGQERFLVHLKFGEAKKSVIVFKSAFKDSIVPPVGLSPLPCRVGAIPTTYVDDTTGETKNSVRITSIIYNNSDLSDKDIEIVKVREHNVNGGVVFKF